MTLNIQQIQEDLKQTFKSNMDQCFPGSGFLNFNYDNFEKNPNNNSKNRKLVYALLLTPDLKLISSLTLHFFRNDEISKVKAILSRSSFPRNFFERFKNCRKLF